MVSYDSYNQLNHIRRIAVPSIHQNWSIRTSTRKHVHYQAFKDLKQDVDKQSGSDGPETPCRICVRHPVGTFVLSSVQKEHHLTHSDEALQNLPSATEVLYKNQKATKKGWRTHQD